jgi:hypothetical protein
LRQYRGARPAGPETAARRASITGTTGGSGAITTANAGVFVQVEGNRQAAIDARDESRERVRKDIPARDRTLTIRDLAEVARESKRCPGKLKGSSVEAWEDALDRVILPELGHLKPIQGRPGEDREADP